MVVLAGGNSKELVPLVSQVRFHGCLLFVYLLISLSYVFLPFQDVPKALLPVANRPVLSFVLEQLELSNLKDLIVVSFGFCFVCFEWWFIELGFL